VGVLAACDCSLRNNVIPVAERSQLPEGDTGLCVDLLKGRMGDMPFGAESSKSWTVDVPFTEQLE